MKILLDDLEDVCSEVEAGDFCIFEQSEEHQIILEGFYIHIPELNVDIYPAVYQTYFEEYQEYMDDYGVFIFFPTGSNEYCYTEGYSNLLAAIHNYTVMSNSNLTLAELTFELVENIAVKPSTIV